MVRSPFCGLVGLERFGASRTVSTVEVVLQGPDGLLHEAVLEEDQLVSWLESFFAGLEANTQAMDLDLHLSQFPMRPVQRSCLESELDLKAEQKTFRRAWQRLPFASDMIHKQVAVPDANDSAPGQDWHRASRLAPSPYLHHRWGILV